MRRAGLFLLMLLAVAGLAVAATGGRPAGGAGAGWILGAVDRGPVTAAVEMSGSVVAPDPEGRMRVLAALEPAEAGRLRPGLRAEIAPAASAGGRVAAILLAVEPPSASSGPVLVLAFDPSAAALPAGGSVALRIVLDRRDRALRVPDAALRWRPAGSHDAVLVPPPVRAGPARGAADLLDLVARELGWDAETIARADAALKEAERAAFGALAPEADHAVRRERFKAMRRDMRERLTAIAGPERKARVHELVAAWSDARRREETRVGVFHVPDPDGRPRAVPVRLGIGDGIVTEVLGAPVEPGTPVIVGAQPPAARWSLGSLRLGF